MFYPHVVMFINEGMRAALWEKAAFEQLSFFIMFPIKVKTLTQ